MGKCYAAGELSWRFFFLMCCRPVRRAVDAGERHTLFLQETCGFLPVPLVEPVWVPQFEDHAVGVLLALQLSEQGSRAVRSVEGGANPGVICSSSAPSRSRSSRGADNLVGVGDFYLSLRR